jgi:uncharacterized protein with FMN-binding domain
MTISSKPENRCENRPHGRCRRWASRVRSSAAMATLLALAVFAAGCGGAPGRGGPGPMAQFVDYAACMRSHGIQVVIATIAGLAGVLSFHTKPATLSLGQALGPAAPGSSPTSAATSTTTGPASSGPPATSSPSTTPAATRTATGAAVNYSYGVVSVAATVSGTKLTNVTIASIDDGGNFRSQSIDQQSVPVLEQEALQAQSANVQSVSGASYTSAGFEQSLQSALTQLGFK